MTETVKQEGVVPGGGRSAQVGLLAMLGAASGAVAGLIDFTGIFDELWLFFPVPGTDFEIFVGSSVVVPGALFGAAMAAALARHGLTNGAGATFILASTAASLVGGNVGYFVALSSGLAEETGEFWVLSASLDGAVNAVILATAAALSFAWCKAPKTWLLLTAAGTVAAIICANLAFGWMDETVQDATSSPGFLWAWLAQMAIFYTAFGGALGFVAPAGPHSGKPRAVIAPSGPTVIR